MVGIAIFILVFTAVFLYRHVRHNNSSREGLSTNSTQISATQRQPPTTQSNLCEDDRLAVAALEDIQIPASARLGDAPPEGPRLRTEKHEKYSVGLICALPEELAAATAMLDERHEPLPQNPRDDNNYTLGRMGSHNVVIACLPSGGTGNNSAAAVAKDLLSTFTSIRFGLMVGVGGGAPSKANDIRLGDVVISKPAERFGGVIQYDFGKTMQKGRFERTGTLNRPPAILLSAMSTLQAKHKLGRAELSKHLSQMLSKYPILQETSVYPGAQQDQLFQAGYDHQTGHATCGNCDNDRLIPRSKREGNIPAIHYGLIASANRVMRDGETREKLREEYNVLCFEMEAAGLMDNFPCLVIRGICDYADAHKNKLWQPYAAAVAAAYAKELLCTIRGDQVPRTQTAIAVTTAGVD